MPLHTVVDVTDLSLFSLMIPILRVQKQEKPYVLGFFWGIGLLDRLDRNTEACQKELSLDWAYLLVGFCAFFYRLDRADSFSRDVKGARACPEGKKRMPSSGLFTVVIYEMPMGNFQIDLL